MFAPVQNVKIALTKFKFYKKVQGSATCVISKWLVDLAQTGSE